MTRTLPLTTSVGSAQPIGVCLSGSSSSFSRLVRTSEAALYDTLRNTRQPCHVYSVERTTCAAGDDLPQEDYLVPPFFDRHVKVSESLLGLGQVDQFVVVRGKQGPGTPPQFRGDTP